VNNIKWVGLTFSLKLDELISRIKFAKGEVGKLSNIEIVPVAFFNPNLFLKDYSLSNDNIINFNTFSYGEQQLVHTKQSIFYHLINLNSVSSDKYCYSNINIVLDEIELYFHPEYQRKLVKELLNGIGQLEIKKIETINLLFLTHSPFILSDIPATNTLHLDDGKIHSKSKEIRQTFGANIHELLKNDFFLQRFMGDVAYDFITGLIEDINEREEKSITKSEEDELILKINLIGEPFFRVKLTEMLFEKLADQEEGEIKKLIAEKTKEIEDLNKQLKPKSNDIN
jgi:hypothetical protein